MVLFPCCRMKSLALAFLCIGVVNVMAQAPVPSFGKKMQPTDAEKAQRKAEMEKSKTETKAHQDGIVAALGSITDEESMVAQVQIIKAHVAALFAADSARADKMRPFEGKEGSGDDDNEDARRKRADAIVASKNNNDSDS